MSSLQQYIAEEIATDHVEGLLTRREAMRRLALLGLGVAVASYRYDRRADQSGAAPVDLSGPARVLTR